MTLDPNSVELTLDEVMRRITPVQAWCQANGRTDIDSLAQEIADLVHAVRSETFGSHGAHAVAGFLLFAVESFEFVDSQQYSDAFDRFVDEGKQAVRDAQMMVGAVRAVLRQQRAQRNRQASDAADVSARKRLEGSTKAKIFAVLDEHPGMNWKAAAERAGVPDIEPTYGARIAREHKEAREI